MFSFGQVHFQFHGEWNFESRQPKMLCEACLLLVLLKSKGTVQSCRLGWRSCFGVPRPRKTWVCLLYSYNFVKTDRPHRFVHLIEVKFIFKNLDVYYIYIYYISISGFTFKATSFQLEDSSVFFHNGKQRSAWIHFLKRTFSAILHQGGLFRSRLMIILPFNTALTNIPPTNKGKGNSPDFILGRVDMLVQLIFSNNLRLKKGRRCFFPLGLIAKTRDTCKMMNKKAICTGVLQ